MEGILEVLEERDFKNKLENIMLSLIEQMRNPIFQVILIRRYYCGVSRKEIARHLGYHRENIRLLELKALSHLRILLTKYYPEYCIGYTNNNGSHQR